MPDYYARYINLVADVELSQAFDDSIDRLNELNTNLLEKLDKKAAALNKWTTKQIFQHLIDWERILTFRAMLFARREGSIPQSFDQDRLAENMFAERRTFDSLIAELKAVHLASKMMFENFDEQMLLARGTSWKYEISVLALGFALVGHQIHHLKLIQNNY